MTQPFSGRREDDRLVTGVGCYTADWNLAGQAYAVFLRSDRPHARIISLDVSAARAHPGVFAVLTGEDAIDAGLIAPPSTMQAPGRGGRRISNPRRYALSPDCVRYVGENIAMVVGESIDAAADAVELIKIEYEDLPAVVDPEDALAPGAPLVHQEIPGNVCYEVEYGDEIGTSEAFARATYVARVTVDSQRVVGNPMEPRACLAAWDSATDSCDFYSGSQGMGRLRGSLASFSRVPVESIRCHAQDVGGAFGIRFGAYAEYAAAMLASRRLGRPVKWTGSTETVLTDYHGRAIRIAGELALDADGRFLAIRARFTCDQGAYLSEAGAHSSIGNLRIGLTGAYRIPVAYGLHRLVMTNTSPIGAYRGAGRPDITYLVEQLVDQAAVATGFDRIELRRRNFIPREAFPYKTATQAEYDSADFLGLLEEGLRRADWAGFPARREHARTRGRLLGLGCAAFIEPSGGAAPPKEQIAVRFEGDRIFVHCMPVASGQGHETVFPELLASVLGVPEDRITLRAGEPTDHVLMGGAAFGSRTAFMVGGAVIHGAKEIIKFGTELAANELEASPQDIEFAGGVFSVQGTDRRIRLLELARRHAGKFPHPLDAIGETRACLTFPSGVHIAEVEVDPETGVCEVTRYLGVDDCGRVLNATLLEGQLHGGIAQGAGQVFGEHGVYERVSGQMLTATFLDYYMPRSDLLPHMMLVDRSVPSPANALGAKGAGEAGTTAGLATLAGAVVDALRQVGVQQFQLPASPSRVWEALRTATSERNGLGAADPPYASRSSQTSCT